MENIRLTKPFHHFHSIFSITFNQALIVDKTIIFRKEFDRILQYLHSIDYFNIPDYKYVLYAIEHAQKVSRILEREKIWNFRNETSTSIILFLYFRQTVSSTRTLSTGMRIIHTLDLQVMFFF